MSWLLKVPTIRKDFTFRRLMLDRLQILITGQLLVRLLGLQILTRCICLQGDALWCLLRVSTKTRGSIYVALGDGDRH